jgi:hypothetical protein
MNSDVDIDELMNNVYRLLNAVDRVVRMGIHGGEVFLYSGLKRLIDELVASDKVNKVHIVTNATIIPDESLLLSFKSPKVYVDISDYGELSSKKAEMMAVFAKNKIAYNILPMMGEKWNDLGGPSKRGRTPSELHEMFYGNCAGGTSKVILKNKLYACFRAAALDDLGLKSAEKGDFICFDEDKGVMRKSVLHFIMDEEVPACCDYCDGAFGAKVKPAIQLKSSIDE